MGFLLSRFEVGQDGDTAYEGMMFAVGILRNRKAYRGPARKAQLQVVLGHQGGH